MPLPHPVLDLSAASPVSTPSPRPVAAWLKEALRIARLTFTHADFVHERVVRGKVIRARGLIRVDCHGRDPDCDTCRRARAAARRCQELGDQVLGALGRQDYERARRLADSAVSAEAEVRDPRVWRGVRMALEPIVIEVGEMQVKCERGTEALVERVVREALAREGRVPADSLREIFPDRPHRHQATALSTVLSWFNADLVNYFCQF